jgi:hypothetical protein
MQSNTNPFPPSIPRAELLEGPSSLLVISHTGSTFDYDHQKSVVCDVVSADRTRQLLEQSESNHRPFCIEFPTRALVAASPAFAALYDSQGGPTHIPLSLANVLPGFAMSVLDWYAKALRSKEWYDFPPLEPLTEYSDDVWNFVYSYAAMRSLGFIEFAERLHKLVMPVLDNLCSDLNSYAHLLRALGPNDPVLLHLAQVTAQKMQSGTLPLSDDDCKVLAENFHDFGTAVNRSLV